MAANFYRKNKPFGREFLLRLGAGGLALLLLLLCPLWVAAQPQTVRVGFYPQGQWMFQSQNGSYEGYGVEYLSAVSNYGGWRYEMVAYETQQQALDALARGEIDLVPGVHRSQEQGGTLLYSALPLAYLQTTLEVRDNDGRYDYEDYEKFSGMQVGLLGGSADQAAFAAYSSRNNFSPQIVPYQSQLELEGALRGGQVDAIVLTHWGPSSFRPLAQLPPTPVYAAVAPGGQELLAQWNSAQATIKQRDAGLEGRLWTKYLGGMGKKSPSLTKEERDYVTEKGVVTAVYDDSWAPLAYSDPTSGDFAGPVAQLFQRITSYTGLHFRFISATDYQEALALSQGPDIDVVCTLGSGFTSHTQNNLRATGPYLQAGVCIVTNQPQSPAIVAALQGYPLGGDWQRQNPEKQVLYFDTPRECFDALRRGETQGVLINSYLAEYQLASGRYSGFVATPLAGYSETISIGVSHTADPRLFNILDQCALYLGQDAMDELVLTSWAPQDDTWQAQLWKEPLSGVEIVGGILSMVALVLAFLLVMSRKRRKQAEVLAQQDGLTGLWSLQKFRHAATNRLKTAPDGTVALVYLDIKGFGTINDTLGFAEGDALLRALAHLMEEELQPGEFCCRASADQFALLAEYSGWFQLNARMEALDRQLSLWAAEKRRPYRPVLVGGVYVVDTAEGGDVNQMLDLANYARRNSTVGYSSHLALYDSAMRQQEQWQRTLQEHMYFALAQGEFLVEYQPRVALETGQVVGAEALCRWIFPGKGVLQPNQFIQSFETLGFITQLDYHVFESACQMLRQWLNRGLPLLPIACNFSPKHLQNPQLAEELVEIAQRYQVPREFLVLELPQRALLGQEEQILGQLGRLKGWGFGLSIDDFGLGQLPITTLSRAPVDSIRISRHLLEESKAAPRELATLASLVQLARQLSVEVSCLGVETQEQAQQMQSLGCTQGQGFYFGKAQAQDLLEGLLATQPH